MDGSNTMVALPLSEDVLALYVKDEEFTNKGTTTVSLMSEFPELRESPAPSVAPLSKSSTVQHSGCVGVGVWMWAPCECTQTCESHSWST